MKEQKQPQDRQTELFQNFIELLGIYTDASNRIAELENDANDHLLALLTSGIDDYSKLQVTLTNTEQALELICRAHPEWFGDKKSITTPYGTAKLHSTTKLEISNPEATLLLIKHEGERNTEFKAVDFIHSKEEPNLEALEKLPDTVLKNFRIFRVKDESFSVVPAKVKMGKAVKEATKAKEQQVAA